MSEPTAGEVLGLLADYVEISQAWNAGTDNVETAMHLADTRLSELNVAHLRTLAAAPKPPIQVLQLVWEERICEYKTNEDRASLRDSETAANAWMGKGMELRRCLDELVSATALTPPAPASDCETGQGEGKG